MVESWTYPLIGLSQATAITDARIDYAVMITSDVRGCLARSEVQVTAAILRKDACRSDHKARHNLLCYYIVTRTLQHCFISIAGA
jgi:hypothetical protein